MKDNNRQFYRNGKWSYLLDDDVKTARIVKGHIGRCKRFRIPESVEVDGERYKIVSVEIDAFNKAKCLKHLVIPDSIEFIDEYNFSSLPSLRSIYVGKGLQYVSSWIFHSNKKLRNFVIDKENPHYFIEKGIVYTIDGKTAVTSPFEQKRLRIREGVEVVENIAFWYNKNLVSIAFPSTLRIIGDNSFAGCENLTEVVLPEGLEKCVCQSFQDCSRLAYVDLPSTLRDLDYEMFYECPSLRTLILRKEELLIPKTFNNKPFYIPDICTLKVPKHLVEDYRRHPLWAKAKHIEEI